MNPNRRSFLWTTLAAAGAYGQTQPVACRIVDAKSGNMIPARVRIVDARGQERAPLGHVAAVPDEGREGDVRFQSRRYSYVDGQFGIDPAWLPVRYQVIKGYEYTMSEGEIRSSGAFRIPLTRWSSISSRGWYSGDTHIHHISPKTCRLEMDAEDLNVANILTSDFTTDQGEFEGQVNANSGAGSLIYVSQEFRHNDLGHMSLLNLKKLIEPVKTMQHVHYPLHLDVCDRAHAQGGYVTWAHFPSMPGIESPLDVALEKLDGLEILCVLEPRVLPVFAQQMVPEVTADNGLHMWYRYLNCGFRLTATAGTDKMTNFVTVGANRVYAHVDGEFTYENWIEALRRGRTFVSNSPLLEFSVNGQEAGSTLALSSGRDKVLQIHARSESQLPYDRLEIVRNGEVIAQASPSGAMHTAEIHLEHPLEGSCWIAARALEDLKRYSTIDFHQIHSKEGTLLSSLYGTRRPEYVFAHSSPVYVIRDERPIRNSDDAQYYIGYMDNAIRWLNKGARFARESDKKASIEAFERGKAVYVERARKSRS
jgi:hypothetical protein